MDWLSCCIAFITFEPCEYFMTHTREQSGEVAILDLNKSVSDLSYIQRTLSSSGYHLKLNKRLPNLKKKRIYDFLFI